MNKENMTFEQSMVRLEQIVRAMERGDVALEESLKLFQEGTELVRSCGKLLEEAQLQVNKIMVASDGSPVEEDFPYEAHPVPDPGSGSGAQCCHRPG